MEDQTEESVYVIDVFVYLDLNTRGVLVKTVRYVFNVGLALSHRSDANDMQRYLLKLQILPNCAFVMERKFK